MQGSSPKLTQTASGINEAPIDDPDYLYLHHERCRTNDISTWNERACKGNSKAIKTFISDPFGASPKLQSPRRVGFFHGLACYYFWQAKKPLNDSLSGFGEPLPCFTGSFAFQDRLEVRLHKLRIRASDVPKTTFKTSGILGTRVSKEGIRTDPAKIEATTGWTRPTSPTEIHSFWGWQAATGGVGLGGPLTQKGKVIAYALR
ncbi:hypothetical protein MTR67_017520 [Solanum verrucosum]|uniref:Uncharacterized protein n=1 Tax=Solanum verrucosum TaxID=315347 RepID=A0AAF0QMZ5_SOLVR|nr:hypothetical protein MTR67_017520 [Solanum verrucosum]